MPVSKGEVHFTNIKYDITYQTYQHLRDAIQTHHEAQQWTENQGNMLTAANADTSVCTLDVIVFAFPGIPHKGVHFKDFSDAFRILQKKQSSVLPSVLL